MNWTAFKTWLSWTSTLAVQVASWRRCIWRYRAGAWQLNKAELLTLQTFKFTISFIDSNNLSITIVKWGGYLWAPSAVQIPKSGSVHTDVNWAAQSSPEISLNFSLVVLNFSRGRGGSPMLCDGFSWVWAAALIQPGSLLLCATNPVVCGRPRAAINPSKLLANNRDQKMLQVVHMPFYACCFFPLKLAL